MVGGRFEFVVGAWRFVRGMRGHSFQVELGRSTRTFGICLLWFGDALGLVRRRPGGGLGLFWGWFGDGLGVWARFEFPVGAQWFVRGMRDAASGLNLDAPRTHSWYFCDGLGMAWGWCREGLGAVWVLFGGWSGNGLGVGGRFEFVVGAWPFVRGMCGHSFQVELGRSTRNRNMSVMVWGCFGPGSAKGLGWLGFVLGMVRGWLGGLGAV